MARRQGRVAADFPQVRFSGPRWEVLMCEMEWKRFVQEIQQSAFARLTAFLELFCEDGPEDLPKGAFRWFTQPSKDDQGDVLHGAFESRGVVLQGRRGLMGNRERFFVISITEDPPDNPNFNHDRRRKTKQVDPRQSSLPFNGPSTAPRS
jgi:hypothetical protein